jgi:hypothetical protein
VAEIGRLHRVCFGHEQAMEHLGRKAARLVHEDAEDDRSELAGFLLGFVVCLLFWE